MNNTLPFFRMMDKLHWIIDVNSKMIWKLMYFGKMDWILPFLTFGMKYWLEWYFIIIWDEYDHLTMSWFWMFVGNNSMEMLRQFIHWIAVQTRCWTTRGCHESISQSGKSHKNLTKNWYSFLCTLCFSCRCEHQKIAAFSNQKKKTLF